MKARTHKITRQAKPAAHGPLANLSLGKLDISTEEILADLRYPSVPSRSLRR